MLVTFLFGESRRPVLVADSRNDGLLGDYLIVARPPSGVKPVKALRINSVSCGLVLLLNLG